jgi:hypothetical protein
MPRLLQRTCLEAGLKLDLNRLMRQGCVVAGAYSAFRIRWTNNYTGEETVSAAFTAHMMDRNESNLRIWNRPQRADNLPCTETENVRRTPMVLRLPGDESVVLSFVATTRRNSLL